MQEALELEAIRDGTDKNNSPERERRLVTFRPVALPGPGRQSGGLQGKQRKWKALWFGISLAFDLKWFKIQACGVSRSCLEAIPKALRVPF